MPVHLQREIENLKKDILTLSAMAEHSVREATLAIEKYDEALERGKDVLRMAERQEVKRIQSLCAEAISIATSFTTTTKSLIQEMVTLVEDIQN